MTECQKKPGSFGPYEEGSPKRAGMFVIYFKNGRTQVCEIDSKDGYNFCCYGFREIFPPLAPLPKLVQTRFLNSAGKEGVAVWIPDQHFIYWLHLDPHCLRTASQATWNSWLKTGEVNVLDNSDSCCA